MTVDADGAKTDNAGSITMCEGSMGIMNHNFPTFDCTTYEPSAATFDGGEAASFDQTTKSFVGGQWSDSSQEWRWKDVRLYGPSATDIHMDLEPEGGAFTDDGKYFLAVLQDNNAYMMFDVAAKKYLFMSGFGYKEDMTMDASDKDDYINIKSRWGSQNIKVQGMYMPDVVSSITINGEYFFLTANEGDTRDGTDDMIGQASVRGLECFSECVRGRGRAKESELRKCFKGMFGVVSPMWKHADKHMHIHTRTFAHTRAHARSCTG